MHVIEHVLLALTSCQRFFSSISDNATTQCETSRSDAATQCEIETSASSQRASGPSFSVAHNYIDGRGR